MQSDSSHLRSRKVAGNLPPVEALEQRCLFSAPTFPIQIHKLPKGTNFPGNLTVGTSGNVWFTCGLAHEIGYITPAGKTRIFRHQLRQLAWPG